jgi:flagellar motor switch protein FliG
MTDLATPPVELSGAQKAAILVMHLGGEIAPDVLKLLGESEVTKITAEILRAGSVGAEESEVTFNEFKALAGATMSFASGGVDMARELLGAALGESRADEILENLRGSMVSAPFDFLRYADPRQVLNFLSGEHPQTIALVLAHMPAEQSSMILGGLNEDMQRDVSIRIATLEQSSPETVAQVESLLERRLSSVLKNQNDAAAADGVQTLIDILNRSDRTTERSIFEGLEEFNGDLADEVRSRMFVFEDITTLEDRAVQLVLRQVESKELAIALKGVREEVRLKIMKNMSERAGQNLAEEIVLLGPVRMTTVEESQGAIVRVIRALEESGQIVVSRGNDEFVS